MRRFMLNTTIGIVCLKTNCTTSSIFPSQHRSTYWGIRNFCLANSSACFAKARPPRPSRATFASTTPKARVLVAAEQEWLQAEEARSVSLECPQYIPTSRFDWRLRSSSREPGLISKDPQCASRGRYVKRVQPPCLDVRTGEPFFEEIQSYKTRYGFTSLAMRPRHMPIHTGFWLFLPQNKLKKKRSSRSACRPGILNG